MTRRSPLTAARLLCPGASWLMVMTSARSFGSGRPTLASNGAVTTVARPRSTILKQDMPYQVSSTLVSPKRRDYTMALGPARLEKRNRVSSKNPVSDQASAIGPTILLSGGKACVNEVHSWEWACRSDGGRVAPSPAVIFRLQRCPARRHAGAGTASFAASASAAAQLGGARLGRDSSWHPGLRILERSLSLYRRAGRRAAG